MHSAARVGFVVGIVTILAAGCGGGGKSVVKTRMDANPSVAVVIEKGELTLWMTAHREADRAPLPPAYDVIPAAIVEAFQTAWPGATVTGPEAGTGSAELIATLNYAASYQTTANGEVGDKAAWCNPMLRIEAKLTLTDAKSGEKLAGPRSLGVISKPLGGSGDCYPESTTVHDMVAAKPPDEHAETLRAKVADSMASWTRGVTGAK